MKTMNTAELLRELIIHVKNDTNAKSNHQIERKVERKRSIETIKSEIIRRSGGM